MDGSSIASNAVIHARPLGDAHIFLMIEWPGHAIESIDFVGPKGGVCFPFEADAVDASKCTLIAELRWQFIDLLRLRLRDQKADEHFVQVTQTTTLPDENVSYLTLNSQPGPSGLRVEPKLDLCRDAEGDQFKSTILLEHRKTEVIKRTLAQLSPDITESIAKILYVLEEIRADRHREDFDTYMDLFEELGHLKQLEAGLQYLDNDDGITAILEARDKLKALGVKDLDRIDTLAEDRYEEALRLWQEAVPVQIAGELDADHFISRQYIDPNISRKLNTLLIQTGDQLHVLRKPEDKALVVLYWARGETYFLPPGKRLVAHSAWLEPEGGLPAAASEMRAALQETADIRSKVAREGDAETVEEPVGPEKQGDVPQPESVGAEEPYLGDRYLEDLVNPPYESNSGTNQQDSPELGDQIITTDWHERGAPADHHSVRDLLLNAGFQVPTDGDIEVLENSLSAPEWLSAALDYGTDAVTGSDAIVGLRPEDFWAQMNLPFDVRRKVLWQILSQASRAIPRKPGDAERLDLAELVSLRQGSLRFANLGALADSFKNVPGLSSRVWAALTDQLGLQRNDDENGFQAGVLVIAAVLGRDTKAFWDALGEADLAAAHDLATRAIDELSTTTAE